MGRRLPTFPSARDDRHLGAGEPFLPFRQIVGQLLGDIELEWLRGTLSPHEATQLWLGIPEAVDENGEAFGFERLEQSFAAEGTPQEVHDRILSDLADFEGDQKLRDDRSLVVIARQLDGQRSATAAAT